MLSPETDGSWDVFVPFTAMHGITVAICLALIAALAMLGRALRETRSEPHLRHAIAAFAIVFWIVYNTWWNWGGLDLYSGLPLHFCDVLGLLAPIALLTLYRPLRATLYFWAFAFTLQGFIQPVLAIGPGHFVFWSFWMAHTIILGCAVYDLVVGGFHPDWSDFRRAAITSFCYVLVAVPVNMLLGANYGYIGNPPPERTIPPMVEALGSWPGRIVYMAALAALAFIALLLPWRAAVALRRTELSRLNERVTDPA